MNTDFFLLFLSFLTIASLMSTLVFIVGIVWRVEMELDLSYKFQAFAIFLLLIAEILDHIPTTEEAAWFTFMLPVLKLLVAGNLFLGIYFMRDLIRRMDGEKKSTFPPAGHL